MVIMYEEVSSILLLLKEGIQYLVILEGNSRKLPIDTESRVPSFRNYGKHSVKLGVTYPENKSENPSHLKREDVELIYFLKKEKPLKPANQRRS